MRQRHHLFILVLAVLAVYLNSFRGVFQFDDYNVIVNNSTVHSWQAWLSDIREGIRPVLKLSYMLNWTSGAGVFGFHLVNVSIHAANVILFYFISMKIASALMSGDARQGKGVAFLASLFFALHPVQTEAVTYISGRSVSLMAMFYLAAILVYLNGIESRNMHIRTVLLYIFSPMLFVIAVMTRETAVTLPLALLLIEKVCNTSNTWVTLIKRQSVHWLLLIVILFALIAHPNHGSLLEYSFDIRAISDNILTQINGVFYLLTRLIVMNGMNIDPDLPVILNWNLVLAAKAILLASLLCIGFLGLRTRAWLTFGILWFFLHLLPTNSVVPRLDVANDRHLYLASAGLFFAAACGIEKFRIKATQKSGVLSKAVTLLTVTVLAITSVFTIARNHVYRSEIALWEDTRQKSPYKARVHNNLGYAYSLEGRNMDAKNAYLAALSLEPDYTIAINNLAELNKWEK